MEDKQHYEKQGPDKTQDPIKPMEKLFTNAGTTYGHAIKDHTLFLCIIQKNVENV